MKKTEGFTLIETIIYVAIVGIVVSSFVGFGLSITGAKNKTYVAGEVQANTRFALEKIIQYVREAKEVKTPIFASTTDYLVLGQFNSEPDIVINTNNGILYLTSGTEDPIALTSQEVQITSLTFNNLAGAGEVDNIQVEMATRFKVNTDVFYSYNQSVKTTVSRRL